MKQLLMEFENLLREVNPAILEIIQPGLPADRIAGLLEKVTVLNDNLVNLYAWKNGIDLDKFPDKTIIELEVFPDAIMLSLEEVVNIYHQYTKQKGIWATNLLPLFTDGGGNYLLMDIDDGSETSEMLLLYSPSLLLSESPCTIYDSLECFFRTAVECIKQGIYQIDESGSLDIDYEIKYEVAARLNERSDYWKN